MNLCMNNNMTGLNNVVRVVTLATMSQLNDRMTDLILVARVLFRLHSKLDNIYMTGQQV